MENSVDILIIGGGIAGISCAEALHSTGSLTVGLLSASPFVKTVINNIKWGRAIEEFSIQAQLGTDVAKGWTNFQFHQDVAFRIDTKNKVVNTSGKLTISYKKLCICSGASPKVLPGITQCPLVLTIRDDSSIAEFQDKLKSSKRLVIVGNGGIATELVHKVTGCSVVWVIKDDAISSAFFDPGASRFFLDELTVTTTPETHSSTFPSTGPHFDNPNHASDQVSDLKTADILKEVHSAHRSTESLRVFGGGSGPKWSENTAFEGTVGGGRGNISVEYCAEVVRVEEVPGEFALSVLLTNGSTLLCDLIVSAIGVTPNIEGLKFDRQPAVSAEDGGLCVDEQMRTSIEDVYAAGDVCSPSWRDNSDDSSSGLWFQMKLWTQAKQMGAYAARCMSDHLSAMETSKDFCFEVFCHVTKFFDKKVVLLGRYNGQGLLKSQYEVILRVDKGKEYIKVVLYEGRVVGAVLIGGTDLAETLENLIVNQTDVSHIADHLLDPAIDIEDYFD